MICRTYKLNYITKSLTAVIILTSLLIFVWTVISNSAFAADVTPTSITVTWTAPGDNGTEGVASEYDIRYSTIPIGTANWDNIQQAAGEPAPKPCGSIETFTINDLVPDTWYFIAIITADEANNWSGLSNIIAVKTLSLSLDVDEDQNDIPNDFHLAQNYPNPFNPSTKIDFSIPVTAHVTISIYNTLGQETATIVDELKSPGNYSIVWNGVDAHGRTVSSGIYMYRIKAGEFVATRKMALVQ